MTARIVDLQTPEDPGARETQPETPEAIAERVAKVRGYRVEHNADGSVIIRLEKPVKVNGDAHTRLTIPRITGRHLRNATWTFAGSSDGMQLGELIAFTADLVEPRGAVDELDGMMARNVAMEVLSSLGKHLASESGDSA